jgi:glucose/arabinose dehydrogenase/PKD repeat protein
VTGRRGLAALAAALVVGAGAPAVATATGPATAPGPAAAAAVPAGFTDTVVATVSNPTAFAWTPDGRMLISQDGGQLRVVRDGRLLPAPALDLSARACIPGERGLSGIAVDPAFPVNGFIYLFWTRKAADGTCRTGTTNLPANRVARYRLGADDRVVPGSERVLIDHIPSPASMHNGGDVHIGADGLLYVSVGDGGCQLTDPNRCAALNGNSRRLDLPHGKILRITRDGGVPAGNPYAAAPGARRCTRPAGVEPGTGPCAETFASGLRNPFRMARRPGSSDFYVNDVGQSAWEEIDRLVAGADYGWNIREGHCRTGSTTDCGPTRFTNPIHDYPHDAGCKAITGGAFVPPGSGWPASYPGSYLFADFVCGTIFRLVPRAGGGFTRTAFATDLGGPTHLAFGPYGRAGALYYADYFAGAVHRIAHSAGNTAPVAAAGYRPAGLDVSFDGSASYDPDGGDRVVEWRWTFGDGSAAATSGPAVSHRYAAPGPYPLELVVVDTQGAVSAPFTTTVHAGENPPVVTVSGPGEAARFGVGASVRLSATAADPQDGGLPVTWTVLRRHGDHDHPYAGPVTGPSLTVRFPAPEDLDATTTSRLRVLVSATDSRGLTTTVERLLRPRQVPVTFAGVPSGVEVAVNARLYTTPATVVSWANWVLSVRAPDQTIGGTRYVFVSWSDGGARAHDLRTPRTATTVTARYRRG